MKTMDCSYCDREAMPDPARMETSDPYARRIQILLAKGHYAAAKRALAEAESELEREDSTPLMSVTLADAGVSNRTCNVLDDEFEAVTIGHLLEIKTEDLLTVPMVGGLTIDKIWHAVVLYAASRIDSH